MLPIAVKGISSKLKSKSKRGKKSFDISLDLELPDLAYGFPAGRIGGIFAAELRDRIVDHWTHGRTATGEKRTLSEKAILSRKRDKRILEYATGLKADTSYPNKWWERRKRIVLKHYSKRGMVPSEINGIRFKQSVKAIYMPEYDNGTAINSSGLMVDSLTMALVRPRSQGGIVTSCWIRVRVVKIRQSAAKFVGGFEGPAAQEMTRMIQSDSGWFPRTRFAMRNALDWVERRKQAQYQSYVNRVVNVLKVVSRGMSRYVAR